MFTGSQIKTYLGLIFIVIATCLLVISMQTSDLTEISASNDELTGNPEPVSFSTPMSETLSQKDPRNPFTDICVLVLSNKSHQSLALSGGSSILASHCMVHSNSNAHTAVALNQSDRIEASRLSVVGKFEGPKKNVSQHPIETAADVSDPLQDFQAPFSDECMERNLSIREAAVTLEPGTYCGGIVSIGNSDINLKPGIYVIKNGELIIGGKSTFSGKGVTLIFEGPSAAMSLGVSSKIDLTAPNSGPTAGILMFEEKSAKRNRDFIFRSRRAARLEGLIYLPNSRIVFNGTGRIASKSKWTRLISDRMELIAGSQLVINSDFGSSETPLPDPSYSGNNINVASVQTN